MVETGVAFGRFQIFTLKHMEYILAAKMRCHKLYIGITHADIVSFAATSSLDQHGVTKRDNPLTYLERCEMIQGALLDFGVRRKEFDIIPFPVTQPDLIPQYAPRDATYYLSICREWDEEKAQAVQRQGLKTEILWQRLGEECGPTGYDVRKMVAENREWFQYVPKTVSDYIRKRGIDQRIKELERLYSNPEWKNQKPRERSANQ